MSTFELAACRAHDPELWFPPQSEPWAPVAVSGAAAAVCAGCPVRAACLAYALDTGQAWGVWGGLGPAERATAHRAVPA